MFLLFSKRFCFTILLRENNKIMNILFLRNFHIYALVTYVFHIWLYLIITKQSGDIKQKPGPNSNSSQRFSFCHWNLNSISAHNFIKISLALPHTNWMLYVYQKPILTPVFQMMMTLWKFLVMIYSEQTTHLVLNQAVSVFIIETLFP